MSTRKFKLGYSKLKKKKS